MQFNEYIRSCRNKLQLTQEQMVDELYSYDIDYFEGMNPSMLSRWEHGSIAPSLSRKTALLRYLQYKTNTAFPCVDEYSVAELEDLICQKGVEALIGRKKEYILNLPSVSMSVEDIRVFPLRNFERMEDLIAINEDIHKAFNHPYTQVTLEQFQEWSLHPSNFFVAAEYKNSFIGLFFILKLKPNVYRKIITFQMKKSEITSEHFSSPNEAGSILLLSFYALNNTTAAILFIRYYAYLIANQKQILEIGGITKSNEALKFAESMNLKTVDKVVLDDGTFIEARSQTPPEALASEHVIKMLFPKQNCEEE